MNFFPNGDEEIALIKFISQYQYLNINDVKYFFKTVDYYKKRIRHLVDKNFIRRNKNCLILGELGIEYSKLFGFEYNPINRNVKYKKRLLRDGKAMFETSKFGVENSINQQRVYLEMAEEIKNKCPNIKVINIKSDRNLEEVKQEIREKIGY